MKKLTKSEIRKIYSDKRKVLSEQELESLSKKISDKIIDYFDWDKIQNIHIFLPIKRKKEVNTLYLIDFFWKQNKSVFIPKVQKTILEHYNYSPNTILEENSWGILEPVGETISGEISFDMVITPLLYCDYKGNRVGYGKGFYDQFFARINPKVIKLGVNFFVPNEEIEDVFSGDIPLDYLVTSEAVFSFISKSKK